MLLLYIHVSLQTGLSDITLSVKVFSSDNLLIFPVFGIRSESAQTSLHPNSLAV